MEGKKEEARDTTFFHELSKHLGLKISNEIASPPPSLGAQGFERVGSDCGGFLFNLASVVHVGMCVCT